MFIIGAGGEFAFLKASTEVPTSELDIAPKIDGKKVFVTRLPASPTGPPRLQGSRDVESFSPAVPIGNGTDIPQVLGNGMLSSRPDIATIRDESMSPFTDTHFQLDELHSQLGDQESRVRPLLPPVKSSAIDVR